MISQMSTPDLEILIEAYAAYLAICTSKFVRRPNDSAMAKRMIRCSEVLTASTIELEKRKKDAA